jgi:riboflavin kinase/FMN adenylyltransferase
MPQTISQPAPGKNAPQSAPQALASAFKQPVNRLRPKNSRTARPAPRLTSLGPQFRLTDEAGKLRLLAGTGLAGAVVMTFDKSRAGTAAQDFIHHDLIERLGISGIAVGYDFHFGKGRVGSPSLLVSEAPRLGIEVDVQAHVDIEERPVSSSAIRMALAEGQIEDASAMLGGPWFVTGEVIHGEKRGRDLGYPTANIRLDKNCGLKHGIYAAKLPKEFHLSNVVTFPRKSALKKPRANAVFFFLPANPGRHADRSKGAPESVADSRSAGQRRCGASVPPRRDYVCRTHRGRIRTH